MLHALLTECFSPYSLSSRGSEQQIHSAAEPRVFAARHQGSYVYVGGRGNRRIQLFDNNGEFKTPFLNVGAPWAACITPGLHQYLYGSNSKGTASMDNGEIYKMELDGGILATLALEDRRFWEHPGVDPQAVARAVWQNLREGKRVSGASTLAMQVARMQNPGPRTLLRKGVESMTALVLTLRYGREAVLGHYLRIIPYGNRIHGIAYAARRYLDKPVEDLSWAEIAFLAALPQAPGRMNPFLPQGKWSAIARGKRVLGELAEQGLLSREELELALEQIDRIQIPWRERRPVYALHAALRLREELGGRDFGARPIVDSTLDLQLQQEVSWMTYFTVSSWEKQGAGNAGVIVLDRETGDVLAFGLRIRAAVVPAPSRTTRGGSAKAVRFGRLDLENRLAQRARCSH